MSAKVTPDTKPLRNHAIGLTVGLVIQYILGMATAFFVQFPENGSEKMMWEFARTQVYLVLHILVGFFIALGTLVLFIRSFQRGDKNWKISSGIAFGAVVIAVISGSQFVPSQNDSYSFIMALAFLVALLSLGWGLYQSKDE